MLENRFFPGDLEAQIEAFVDHYIHQRYHESLNNVTPSDVCFGQDKAIVQRQERIKRKTLEARRLHHSQRAAQSKQPDEPDPLLVQATCETKNAADAQENEYYSLLGIHPAQQQEF